MEASRRTHGRGGTGRSVITLAIAVVAVLAVELMAPSVGLGAEVGDDPAREGDVTQVMAAEQLAEDFDLSLDEARARIDRQDDLIEVGEAMAAARPETSAGAYFDHERGGALVVLDTDPAAAAEQVPDDARDHVIVEDAVHTTHELIVLARQVDAARSEDSARVPVATDVVSNQIEVSVDPTAEEDAGVRAVIAEANEQSETPPIRTIAPNDLVPTAECRYAYQLCDAPLRGGIAIRNDFLCTAGFNVESVIDGAHYVLTAGHCTVDLGVSWWTEFSDGSQHTVGQSWSSYFNDGTHTDAGLIRTANVPGWNPQWWVLVRSSSGVPPTTQDERYDITGVGTSAVNAYICKQGSISATNCGRISHVGRQHPTSDRWNMGVLNARSCTGDSGGPIFKSNKGFGIISASDNDHELYDVEVETGLGVIETTCYSRLWYVGMRTALDWTNTKLVGT